MSNPDNKKLQEIMNLRDQEKQVLQEFLESINDSSQSKQKLEEYLNKLTPVQQMPTYFDTETVEMINNLDKLNGSLPNSENINTHETEIKFSDVESNIFTKIENCFFNESEPDFDILSSLRNNDFKSELESKVFETELQSGMIGLLDSTPPKAPEILVQENVDFNDPQVKELLEQIIRDIKENPEKYPNFTGYVNETSNQNKKDLIERLGDYYKTKYTSHPTKAKVMAFVIIAFLEQFATQLVGLFL